MGQYLGGVVNVVVGFYTGNVWEMAGGVMQIVGTKTNNSDLATAGAVVGTVAAVAGAASASSASDTANASSAAGAANAPSQAADLTETGQGGSGILSDAANANRLPSTLQVTDTAGTVAQGAGSAVAQANTANRALSTWDTVKNALSTPTGVQITAGVVGGIGNAYGQAYAAQKNAEAQQALQNQSIAFRQWQANIANTAGTGVVNAAAPLPYGTGLLGPTQSPVTPPGVPALNPASSPAIPTLPNAIPAGLSV